MSETCAPVCSRTIESGVRSAGEWSRRDWLRLAGGAMSAAMAGLSTSCSYHYSACKKAVPNLFVESGQPLLVAVQGEDLGAMLRAGIEALGGLDRLLTLGREAVLKANFISAQHYPVTTSADCISEVAGQLRAAGFAKTTLFEAHGSRLIPALGPEKNMERLGVIDKVRRNGIEVFAGDFLDSDQFRLVRSPDWSIPSPVAVHKMLHEAPVIVSLPVLKRHAEARLTCALKMHFGSVAMADRLVAHKNGHYRRLDYFDVRLVHFADAVKPQLHIVDARAILSRNGPTLGSGGEIVRGVNRLVLSGDMVATDAYCARLMARNDASFSVDMIADQLKHSSALGLGTADLDRVKIVELQV